MLSILIPTYNYNIYPLVKVLQVQCFESGIEYEIIALDDSPGSDKENLNKKINELPNCLYILNNNNVGRTLSRKRLAEKAKYETLLFLDADTEPVNNNFIVRYLEYINTDRVVLGGIAYKTQKINCDKRLRYKYGRFREEKTAIERNKHPYTSILSANLLVPKNIFLKYNYSENHNLYGMDIFFGYQLYINTIKVYHIDNPMFHLGLENDDIFFRKCIESVKSRKELLANSEGIENINSLLKHYKKLRQYQLTGIVSFFFKLGEPLLKKMILKKDPNLFCLDIYRLGYICAIK